jgi:hypothetical protein
MTTEAATTTAPTQTDGQVSTATGAPIEGSTPAAAAPVAQQQQTPVEQTQVAAPAAELVKTDSEQTQALAAAPEKYEFQAPAGQDFDPAVISAYSEIAKELNLPQESAQKIIDKIAPVMAEKQTRILDEARTAWGEAAKSDKEFGGAKFDSNIAVAVKAMNAFGTPELRTLLNESGLGNHPEIIRAFYRAGLKISEDSFVPSNASGSSDLPVAQRMYPNMNP